MNKNLPIYGVPGNIDRYVTSKNESKKGMEKLPPKEFQLTAENIFKPISRLESLESPLELGLTIDDNDIWSPHDALESTTIFARKGNPDEVSLSDFEI